MRAPALSAAAVLAGCTVLHAAPAPQTLKLGSLTAQVPGDWTRATQTSEFRLAQFTLPKAAGDTAATQLIVFSFGRMGGGGVDDNVRRWMGMMGHPETADPVKVAGRKTVETNGVRVTTVDVSGTYKERASPMSPTFTPRSGYRMLAGVIEATASGPGGAGETYYLRMVGPQKSVAQGKRGWDGMIASLKASAPAAGK